MPVYVNSGCSCENGMLSLQLHLPFVGRAENRRACVIKSRNKKRKANKEIKAKVKETKKSGR